MRAHAHTHTHRGESNSKAAAYALHPCSDHLQMLFNEWQNGKLGKSDRAKGFRKALKKTIKSLEKRLMEVEKELYLAQQKPRDSAMVERLEKQKKRTGDDSTWLSTR